MGLLREASEDLKTAMLQPRSYEDDPRGSQYGKRYVDSGAPVRCAWTEMSTTERFQAGRQQSDRMVRIFADLAGGASPVTERQRVRLEGREYDITSVKTVVAEGDEGVIVEAVSV